MKRNLQYFQLLGRPTNSQNEPEERVWRLTDKTSVLCSARPFTVSIATKKNSSFIKTSAPIGNGTWLVEFLRRNKRPCLPMGLDCTQPPGSSVPLFCISGFIQQNPEKWSAAGKKKSGKLTFQVFNGSVNNRATHKINWLLSNTEAVLSRFPGNWKLLSGCLDELKQNSL